MNLSTLKICLYVKKMKKYFVYQLPATYIKCDCDFVKRCIILFIKNLCLMYV